MIGSGSVPEVDRGLRELCRSLAKRCRGRTLIIGQPPPGLDDRLDRTSASLGISATGDAGDEPCDTVLVVGVLEHTTPDESRSIVRDAWRRVQPHGRLLVCVPNGDCLTDGERGQRFTRRGLKRLLGELAWPKLITDQPLRWLVMCVDARPPRDRATERRHRIVARLCHGDVLELGCGPGQLCREIADRGLAVAGIDKSRAKIDRARSLFPEIRFRRADILELYDEPARDTVVLSEVLEHVSQDAGSRILARAWSLVAPGGRLVVSVPNEDCVPHANHLREFTRRDLHGMLRPFGRPRLVRDQPYKWLLMYVDRRD